MSENKSTYFHISECPRADLPSCSMGDPSLQSCSLSCLTLWLGHLKGCEECVTHLTRWPLCGSDHCLRVHQCWNLRTSLLEYIKSQKLTLDGCVLKQDIANLETLLQMDYLGMSYSETDPQSYLTRRTTGVFHLLKMVSELGGILQALDMHIEGVDLISITKTILEGEREAPPS